MQPKLKFLHFQIHITLAFEYNLYKTQNSVFIKVSHIEYFIYRVTGAVCKIHVCRTFFTALRLENFFSKGSPFNFLIFCNRMDVKKSERVLPFSAPGAHAIGLPVRQFGPTFGFFGYCKREYLTPRRPFTIFEPQIWRRLMPFPACSMIS